MAGKIFYEAVASFIGSILAIVLIFCPHDAYRFKDQSQMAFMILWSSWSFIIAHRVKCWAFLPILLLAGASGASIFAGNFTEFQSMAYVLDGSSAITTLWFCLLVTIMSFAEKEIRNIFHEICESAVWLSSILMMTRLHGGLLSVISVDASMIAIVLPAMMFRKGQEPWPIRIIKLGPPIGAVLFNGMGATGIFALVGVLLAYMVLSVKKIDLVMTILGSTIVLMAIGYMTQGPTLLNSSGRMEVWRLILSWWKDHANIWHGMGLGTYEIVGVGIQAQAGLKYAFTYLHNEWLQILFEMGIFGLVASLLFFSVAVYRALAARSWLFLSLASISVVSLTQSPLRIAVIGIYVALIIREAIACRAREIPIRVAPPYEMPKKSYYPNEMPICYSAIPPFRMEDGMIWPYGRHERSPTGVDSSLSR